MIRATRTLLLIGAIAIVFLGFGLQTTDARGPLPPPSPWPSPSASLKPIVHGGCANRCLPVSAPVAQPTPAPAKILPDTDTDPGPAVNVISIWVVAIVILLVVWHRTAWHDDD
jgi:hypothetical protein